MIKNWYFTAQVTCLVPGRKGKYVFLVSSIIAGNDSSDMFPMKDLPVRILNLFSKFEGWIPEKPELKFHLLNQVLIYDSIGVLNPTYTSWSQVYPFLKNK